MTVEEIVADSDVKERVSRYFELDALFREMLTKYTYFNSLRWLRLVSVELSNSLRKIIAP